MVLQLLDNLLVEVEAEVIVTLLSLLMFHRKLSTVNCVTMKGAHIGTLISEEQRNKWKHTSKNFPLTLEKFVKEKKFVTAPMLHWH
jgi:hypothetical protein